MRPNNEDIIVVSVVGEPKSKKRKLSTMSDWFGQLKACKKSCVVDKNLKKVHYELPDGREMVEEYDINLGLATRRIWKVKNGIKGNDEWEVELGDPIPVREAESNCMIKEDSSQPFVTRRNTKTNLEWRIRNLPYPIEVYAITADKESNSVIVRTSNKKYYKKLEIPEMQRLGIEPEQECLAFSHKFNTLIITYKKPKKLLDFEKLVFEEIKPLQAKGCLDDVNNCKTS